MKGRLTPRNEITHLAIRGGITLAGSQRADRITSWLQDAVIKIGSALSGPTTSGMRNFGACRSERRPDVRFCGVGAATSKRRPELSRTGGYRLDGRIKDATAWCRSQGLRSAHRLRRLRPLTATPRGRGRQTCHFAKIRGIRRRTLDWKNPHVRTLCCRVHQPYGRTIPLLRVSNSPLNR